MNFDLNGVPYSPTVHDTKHVHKSQLDLTQTRTYITIDRTDMWHVYLFVAGAKCVLFRGGGPHLPQGEKLRLQKTTSALRKRSRGGEKTQYILPFSPATAIQLTA